MAAGQQARRIEQYQVMVCFSGVTAVPRWFGCCYLLIMLGGEILCVKVRMKVLIAILVLKTKGVLADSLQFLQKENTS